MGFILMSAHNRMHRLVQVMTDGASGKCKGIGFVNYMTHEGACVAMASMHSTVADNHVLHVTLQQHRDFSRHGSHQMPAQPLRG